MRPRSESNFGGAVAGGATWRLLWSATKVLPHIGPYWFATHPFALRGVANGMLASASSLSDYERPPLV